MGSQDLDFCLSGEIMVEKRHLKFGNVVTNLSL